MYLIIVASITMPYINMLIINRLVSFINVGNLDISKFLEMSQAGH